MTYGIGCTSCGQGVCASCKDILVLYTDNSHCIDTVCNIQHCVDCLNNATCYLCQPGYVADETGCVAATCTSPHCLACETTQCKACFTGFNVENGVCKPLCDDNLCKTCFAPGVCG